MDITSPLVRAGQWFLNSGIQSPEGGVARYYRSDISQNASVSTEITGYAASAYAYLFASTHDAAYYDRALLTARFLTRKAWDAELQTYPFEYPGPSPAYFFDCGIIVRGLLAVWRMSREDEFLSAALACAKGMMRDFDSGADFHPILELPSKRPAPRDERWSRSSACYQLKAALGWLELADETGDEDLRTRYECMLECALATEADFLPGTSDEPRVMDRLHAYAYFLEALLPTGRDVSEGIARLCYYLRKIAPSFARSDVYAQLLRVQLLSGNPACEADLRALETFQMPDGGYWFGRKDGQFLPFINPVSTAFAMQAREMWREREVGLLVRDCRQLI
jgi:hypothetical protein